MPAEPPYGAAAILADLEAGAEPLRLAAAAKFPALRLNGKARHISALHRAATRGTGGAILETALISGTRCTTTRAIFRWLRKQNGRAQDAPPVDAGKLHELAERRLKAAGF